MEIEPTDQRRSELRSILATLNEEQLINRRTFVSQGIGETAVQIEDLQIRHGKLLFEKDMIDERLAQLW